MADYVVNKQGAKIFMDSSKHKQLAIPTLLTQQATGKVYEVLSVGFMRDRTPLATVREGGKAIAYLLPTELYGWVENSVSNSMGGVNLFPEKVEFGVLNGRHYAEIL